MWRLRAFLQDAVARALSVRMQVIDYRMRHKEGDVPYRFKVVLSVYKGYGPEGEAVVHGRWRIWLIIRAYRLAVKARRHAICRYCVN